MRNWLKVVRQSQGLTMKQIANQAEISECYYSQIENGSRNVSVLVAKKISKVLGIEWEKFFDEVD